MKTKKMMTALLTVIMLSTSCTSVLAWNWGHHRHHRGWRHHHYRRRHHIDVAAAFAIPLMIAASQRSNVPSDIWREIVNNRAEIRNLAYKIKRMETVIADQDSEAAALTKMINEMRDRIIELESRIK